MNWQKFLNKYKLNCKNNGKLENVMIAIFENRGKQYKVKVGDFLKLPKISELKKKDSVTFYSLLTF